MISTTGVTNVGIQNEDPGKERKKITWTVEKVPAGTFFHAHKAGKHFGAYVHDERPSKPCCTLYTHGQVRCAGCTRGKPIVWLGWVPLYRVEGCRGVVAIIHRDMADPVSQISHGECVRVSRGERKTDPVSIVREPRMPKLQTARPERMNPVDVSCWLLDTLWKLPEFAAWCSVNDTFPVTDEDVMLLMAEGPEAFRKRGEPAKLPDYRAGVRDALLRQNGHKTNNDPPTVGDVLYPTNGKPKPK